MEEHKIKINKAILEIRHITEKIFNKPNILLSFSGGKDSIVMFDIFKRAYRGSWKNVTVVFIDEEAVFEGVIKNTMNVRKEVLALGGKFEWYCMPFLHFSAISSLKEDGVYILWKESEKENWVRDKPVFAITNHNEFRLGMSYQEFFNKVIIPKYDICMQGVRKHESVQRRQIINGLKYRRYGLAGSGTYYPIRELTENDIWKYISDRKLDFPIEYLYIYQMKAVNRKVTSSSQLRMSQLFSSDTIGTLVYLKEFAPELWKRIRKRQPNAYLASLYYGTTFAKDNAYDPKINYIDECIKLWQDPEETVRKPGNKIKMNLLKGYINQKPISDEFNKMVYSYIRTAKGKGDPKGRALRAFGMRLSDYYNSDKSRIHNK